MVLLTIKSYRAYFVIGFHKLKWGGMVMFTDYAMGRDWIIDDVDTEDTANGTATPVKYCYYCGYELDGVVCSQCGAYNE